MMEYMPELLQCSLFRGMEYEEVEQLVQYFGASWGKYRRQEVLLHAGDKMPGILIVLKGKVATTHVGNANMEGTVGILEVGASFGSGYIVTDTQLIVSVRAITAAQVMYLHVDSGALRHPNMPSWYYRFLENLIATMGQKVIGLAQKIDYLHLGSVRAKLAAYFLNQAREQESLTFSLSLNRSRLAEYLCISRPSMVREMGHMEEEGLIALEDKTITILNDSQLNQLICR